MRLFQAKPTLFSPPMLRMLPRRARHSMTNLYEVLGSHREATAPEIEEAYNRLVRIYGMGNNDDGSKTIMDDASLAYNTLVNERSRKEYDDYLDSHIKVASY